MGSNASSEEKSILRFMEKLIDKHNATLDSHSLKRVLRWVASETPGVNAETIFNKDTWDEAGVPLWEKATRGDKVACELLRPWREVLELLVKERKPFNTAIKIPQDPKDSVMESELRAASPIATAHTDPASPSLSEAHSARSKQMTRKVVFTSDSEDSDSESEFLSSKRTNKDRESSHGYYGVWMQIKKDAIASGEMEIANCIAAPVVYDANGDRRGRWESINFSVVKELRRVITDHGLDSPYARKLIESVMKSQTMTPSDCRTMAELTLTSTQLTFWESAFRRFVEKQYQRYQTLRIGDPARDVTLDQMLGQGEFSYPQRQARGTPRCVLDDIRDSAFQALMEVPSAGAPQKAFTEIKQGVDEPFMTFVDRLQDALAKQIPHPEARNLSLLKLAVANANEDCKRILLPLDNPDLVKMVEACNKFGSLSHKYTAKYEAKAAALAALNAKQLTCFGCGQTGHIRKNCKDKPPKGSSEPDLCPRCRKGRHYANQCHSKYDRDGNLLPGNFSRSAPRGRAKTKMVPVLAPAPQAPPNYELPPQGAPERTWQPPKQ